MEYRTFGRTNLRVSIVGVGTGGASRLGLSTGSTEDEAVDLIHRAIELGINYFDTAENYRNEHVLGRAVEHRRDDVVLSSKVAPVRADGALLDRAGLRAALESSLGKLRTDWVDVYHLHRASTRTYDHCLEELVPELLALRDEGKIRFLAISESTSNDVKHELLSRAIEDDVWDVMMIGFNLFNQSARDVIYPTTIAKNIAIEIMASARTQFSNPTLLVAEVRRLIDAAELSEEDLNPADPLDFLFDSGAAGSLTEASYRFAAHEPGVHVVLTGTGNIAHLEQNVASLNAGPLPAEVHDKLVSLFGHLTAEIFVPGRDSSPH